MSTIQDKRDLAACLKRLISSPVKEVLEDSEFRGFNRERNRYNDTQVTKLIEQAPYNPTSPIFKDNLGRIWSEEVVGVNYHSDKWILNPFKILSDEGEALRKWGKKKKNRFSRKFLMPCDLPGYTGASNEMIVQRNGHRITSGDKMETFNFGKATMRSSSSGKAADQQMVDSGLHYKFDIAPRLEFGYSEYRCLTARPVRIIDMTDLFENGDLDLKSLFRNTV